VERVFELANSASERNPANLPKLIAALNDPSEPMRWWAAQGCAMLREKAAPAESALRLRLEDSSGAVQVAAAEALARQGKLDIALPVLERWLQSTNVLEFSLQAANVLDRLGESARPALPAMRRALARVSSEKDPNGMEGYLRRILERSVSVLEGKTPPLVYQTSTNGQ
jgi:hypothetical protein